ncbi:hypothetical protein D3C71_1907320 [compost metagenome]
MGPRAWASVMRMPKVAKASTKIWVGASEPKSTSVPAQSKITACKGAKSAQTAAGKNAPGAQEWGTGAKVMVSCKRRGKGKAAQR